MPKSKTPNIDYMISYVEDYLEGRLDRFFFDLDFDHKLITHYPKMKRENPEYAEAFCFYISDWGIDVGERLSDDEFKALIQRQYDELLDVVEDGFM
jgi:hypothetical protein